VVVLYFQTSVGINIESNRISLVCLKKSVKGFKLAGHAMYPLEKKDSVEKAAEIRTCVNEFLKARRILSADLFLGIQRDLAILRYIELPLAIKENLRGALLYEMEKYVPLPASDIYFDFQIISEDKKIGQIKVLLIAVKKDVVDPFLDSENRLGTGITGIEINSTALVNYLSSKPVVPDAGNYAMVFLDGENLEMCHVTQRFLDYSRSVKIDNNVGSLQNLVGEELMLLRKTLGLEQDRLEVVSCGPDAERVAELFKERKDIPLSFLEPALKGIPSALLAPAYGLALKKIQKVPMDINLLPANLRKKISKTAYYAMFVLAGLLVAAIVGWGGATILHQRDVSYKLESELKRLGAEVAAINKTRDKLKALERKMDALNALRQRHVPVLNVLQDLTRTIPQGSWIDRLAITDKGGDMEGYSDSASALIPLLAASPLLKDVAFLSPITKGRDGKERFRIGFNIER
jgi:general secretion pathway protein L